MAASSAELSSLATALDELTRRVTVHADAANAAKDEETARELFAIERALNSANRRLARLSLALGARGQRRPAGAAVHDLTPNPDATKAPQRVPSSERAGRRIPNSALRNRLAGIGFDGNSTPRFSDGFQSAVRISRPTRKRATVRNPKCQVDASVSSIRRPDAIAALPRPIAEHPSGGASRDTLAAGGIPASQSFSWRRRTEVRENAAVTAR